MQATYKVMRLSSTRHNTFKQVSNYKMESYYLKCRKNTEDINPKVSKTLSQQYYYQNVQYAAVKNQDLLKVKKQKDY